MIHVLDAHTARPNMRNREKRFRTAIRYIFALATVLAKNPDRPSIPLRKYAHTQMHSVLGTRSKVSIVAISSGAPLNPFIPEAPVGPIARLTNVRQTCISSVNPLQRFDSGRCCGVAEKMEKERRRIEAGRELGNTSPFCAPRKKRLLRASPAKVAHD
jgi:hypothetical protein